jgi:hypothetical protein
VNSVTIQWSYIARIQANNHEIFILFEPLVPARSLVSVKSSDHNKIGIGDRRIAGEERKLDCRRTAKPSVS